MHSLVRDTVQVVKPQVEKGRLALKTEVDDEVSTLTGDPRALKQILLNLLSNAIKFTPENGQISLTVEPVDDGHLALTVADTGIGIEAIDIEKVLKPFNQVGSAQVTVHHGTGLGLPIVKSLIELHGGRMHIESAPGVGTTVQVSLPCRQPMATAVAAR